MTAISDEQQEEGDNQREDAEAFGQRRADQRVGELGAGGRGVAQRAGQEVAEDVADADAGAAHADTGDTGADQLCCFCVHFSLLGVFGLS